MPAGLRKALVAAVFLAFGLVPSAARAQFGVGWWFGGYQTPSSVTYLNDRALVNQQAAYASRPQALRAPSRPPRDTTFFERYDIETRQEMESRIARQPSLSRTTPTAPRPEPARPRRPVIALASFFNDYDQIVWPREAPNEGELKEKRALTDAACLAVLKETRQRGEAKVATVTDARNKLLDYGHPALDQLRSRASTPVVEAVTNFLNSLYFALGDAATPRAAKR
jgi:hypothetical protein